MKTLFTSENYKIKRVSRWIKVKTAYNITTRHSLYDYADKISETENELLYFTFHGKNYALNQFLKLAYPVYFYEKPDTDKRDYNGFLSGYDCTDYYNPLLIEIDENGSGYIRLYEEMHIGA